MILYPIDTFCYARSIRPRVPNTLYNIENEINRYVDKFISSIVYMLMRGFQAHPRTWPSVSPLETKGPEGAYGAMRELKEMSKENPTSIPPVVLDDYSDFEMFAKGAVLVLYSPEYFHSPFLDDKKRLRRVTLTALGVRVNGIALTFKHVLDYNNLCDTSKDWNEQTQEIDHHITQIMARLGSEGNLIRGTVETEPSIGEALVMRP